MRRLRATLSTSRLGRAMLEDLTRYLKILVTMLVSFVLTPLIVFYLGDERYGLMLMMQQWFGYLEFLTFGMIPTISVLQMNAISTGGDADVRSVTRTGFARIARQLRMILPATLVFGLAFPWLFGVPDGLTREVYLTLPLTLIGSAMLPFMTFKTETDVRQRGYVVNLALMAQAVMLALVSLGLAYLGLGLPGQSAAMIVSMMTFYAILVWAARSIQGWRSHPKADIPDREFQRLRWPLLIALFGNQINILSDNIFAGVIFDASAVTAFALSRRLPEAIGSFAGLLGGAGNWAALIELRSREGTAAFSKRLAEVSGLNLAMMLILMAPVAGLNERFMELWFRDSAKFAGLLYTVAVILQFVVFGFYCLYAAILDQTGHTKDRLALSTLGTLIKLAAMAPLCYAWGPAGLPIATVLSFLLTDAWNTPRLVCKILGAIPSEMIRSTIRAATIGGVWLSICALLSMTDRPTLPGWWGLGVEFMIFECLGFAIGWFCVLSVEDRKRWAERLSRWRLKSQETPPPTL
jgi:O-antigen/teichoic acid export membrane protein